MTYAVKEIFYSLQGEGAHAGRPAIFCRFSGCNLWSGQEKHRAEAICQFCDTDFVGTDGDGGGSFASTAALVAQVKSYWPQSISDQTHPYVVCTGGEPLLQLDKELIEAFHSEGMEVAIETNGTLPVPEGVDWVCVSPKSGSTLVVQQGDEIKLVYPQQGHHPSDFIHLKFNHFFLQPMFDDQKNNNLETTVEYCLSHPRWSLSLQTHKLLGLP
ncbi:MAG: 7-carboxy-7-deazaguanine synthase [Porticoccaceae bacterium]|jgi:7-carboxy-7-deazaguanine synthase (Cx14CxxC type)|nr:7-carboxy-7-deazaguanine synthase [Porticoccaceae bacterium]|tara:strand:- start:1114 stop:1755 length:642 start_codon:yes stop_codon:yes gene_type:complete